MSTLLCVNFVIVRSSYTIRGGGGVSLTTTARRLRGGIGGGVSLSPFPTAKAKAEAFLPRAIMSSSSLSRGDSMNSYNLSSGGAAAAFFPGSSGDAQVGDAAQLSAWLAQRNIDISAYGKNSAKSVEDLAREIQYQESSISYDAKHKRVTRRVRVLSVIVESESRQTTLAEACQFLPDGRRRERGNLPLSEKMVGDENVQQALERAVKEELGSALSLEDDDGDARITLTGKPVESTETRESHSYPGIHCEYNVVTVTARVGALVPFSAGDGQAFETSEANGHRTQWIWIPKAM